MASNCEVVHPELLHNCPLNDWSEITSVPLVAKGLAAMLTVYMAKTLMIAETMITIVDEIVLVIL